MTNDSEKIYRVQTHRQALWLTFLIFAWVVLLVTGIDNVQRIFSGRWERFDIGFLIGVLGIPIFILQQLIVILRGGAIVKLSHSGVWLAPNGWGAKCIAWSSIVRVWSEDKIAPTIRIQYRVNNAEKSDRVMETFFRPHPCGIDATAVLGDFSSLCSRVVHHKPETAPSAESEIPGS
ncbi:MAG: hypothetical protein ACE363_15950 [Alphaproteobacteria bacterium]